MQQNIAPKDEVKTTTQNIGTSSSIDLMVPTKEKVDHNIMNQPSLPMLIL